MRFTVENNHALNLANFDTLIAKILGYGKYYNPMKSSIHVDALSLVSQNAKAAITNVKLFTLEYTQSSHDCEVAFTSLQVMNEKIYKALQSTTHISETEMHMIVGAGKAAGSNPLSQQQCDLLLENFCRIINLLKANPWYLPQKSELKIQTLEELYAILYLKNEAVKKRYALLNHAHIVTNEVMYRHLHGLAALATTAKMYVKYHFGWDSEEFKQVAGLLIKKAR